LTFSVFAQDTFRISDRLNVLYGLRWEVTPPDHAQFTAFESVGSWNGYGTVPDQVNGLAFLNQFYWPRRYGQIAPRLGLAYHLKIPDVVLRAGAGIFYDTALGSLIYPVNLSPLNTWQFLPSGSNLNPAFPVYPSTTAPVLSLPRVLEWRTSIEKSFEGRSTLSLAYTGAAGRRLLRLEGSVDPASEILEGTVFTSQGASNYDALAAQFSGNLTPNLYTLVSYT
jgi:hypothetical protein